MADLTHVEAQLREMGCPRCYSSDLEVIVQLEGENGLPGQFLSCRQCGFRWNPSEIACTWQEMEQRITRTVRRKGCPKCGSHRLDLSFRCSLASRQCFHVASCRECGTVFIVEKRIDDPRSGILDM